MVLYPNITRMYLIDSRLWVGIFQRNTERQYYR